jgi:hypothetical protein
MTVLSPVVAIAAVAAGVAIGYGADMITAPVRVGGPMGIDFDPLIGAIAIVLGVLGIEGLALGARQEPRVAYLVAALGVAIFAGQNFYRFPPIDDGAYFLLRYGRDGGEWVRAEPSAYMLSFAALGWSLERASAGQRTSGFVLRVVVLGVFTVAACAVFTLFMRLLVGGSGIAALSAVVAAALVVAIGLRRLTKHRDWARTGCALSLTLALLSLAGWGLYSLY